MERDSYASGTPSWVDMGSPDVEATVAFYSALLGWEVAEAHPDAGGYRIALLRGKAVAGIGPMMGPTSAWTTYFATDDTDATVETIKANGGSVMMGPMDVMDQGRMAIAMDPEGAAFGLWQAAAHTGSQLVNETGTFGWNELWTRGIDQAKVFYPAVFGFGLDESMGRGYVMWTIDGQMVGGALPMPEGMPPRVPAHWAVYFVVDDTDQAVARVNELGGMTVQEPFDVPNVGRLAMVHGPAHESFGLFATGNQPTT